MIKGAYWVSAEIQQYFKKKDPNPLIVEWLQAEKRAPEDIKSVIDAGCGYGRNLVPFAKGRTELYCFDPCEDATIYTRERLAIPIDHTRSAALANRAWEDSQFELVICDGVLHQLQSPQELEDALDYLSSLVIAGGFIFISVFTGDIEPGKSRCLHENIWQNELGVNMILLESGELLKKFKRNGLTVLHSKSESFILDVGVRSNLTSLLQKEN